MMILKRSECAILSLVLTRKWYVQIFSGKKLEEYRDATKYWRVRLSNWVEKSIIFRKTLVIEFRRGYSSYAPRMAFLAKSFEGGGPERRYFARAFGASHPEWGEPKGNHFVIGIGERVELTKESEAAK